ncbi:hypothetical protein RZO55_12355, partial [Clostridium boliviensis]|nr:hypothetical protein [Clostridium boliviensis]
LSIPYVFEGEAYIRPGHVGVKVHHYMPHFRRAIPGERTVINGSLLVVNQQGHWEFKGKEELNLMYRIMHHPKKEVWGGEMTGIDSWGNPVERTYGNPDFPEGG